MKQRSYALTTIFAYLVHNFISVHATFLEHIGGFSSIFISAGPFRYEDLAFSVMHPILNRETQMNPYEVNSGPISLII